MRVEVIVGCFLVVYFIACIRLVENKYSKDAEEV
jgi:hypothetical protein